MTGRELFACYAYPPNELGYCGPADTSQDQLASHAKDFDGAWPYLEAIADAAGIADPLDEDVVRNYWVGGALLDKVDPDDLLTRLRSAFAGQVTGMLDGVPAESALAHHSFHVFVVYPWVRFLDRDPTTPLQVMQDCRIRWGTVESVDGDHAVISSAPLTFGDGALGLGDARAERVRWRKQGASLTPAPQPGGIVAAHWDWVCTTLTDDDAQALLAATRKTLDLVNTAMADRARR
ncbi:hypothetical protein DVS77_27635 [Mycolicibacterium moriokaense]|nr:hypothetical protein DVS77_27635 [Mycolicibacterium moriokaense]